MASQSSTSEKSLHIGVLLLPSIQLLDLAPVDLFAMLRPEYLTACSLPSTLVRLGVPVKITYIAESGAGSIVETTASTRIKIDVGLDDESVRPQKGKLDILFIPGPDPEMIPSEEMRKFVREHVEMEVVLITICTGVFVAGHSGVLDGKSATGPRVLIGNVLEKKFPKARWRKDVRWVNDGNIWTSGGITNGNDMVAAYMRQTFPAPVVDAICAMADVGDRERVYGSSMTTSTLWWVLTVFKAWSRGLFVSK